MVVDKVIKVCLIKLTVLSTEENTQKNKESGDFIIYLVTWRFFAILAIASYNWRLILLSDNLVGLESLDGVLNFDTRSIRTNDHRNDYMTTLK